MQAVALLSPKDKARFKQNFLCSYHTFLGDLVEMKKRNLSMQEGELNPSVEALILKEQILLSYSYTFLMRLLGRSYSDMKKNALGDDIINSHDLRG